MDNRPEKPAAPNSGAGLPSSEQSSAKPASARDAYLKAEDLFDGGEYQKSLKAFKKIAADFPKSEWGHIGLSKVYCRLREYEKSEEAAKTAIRLNPKSYDARFCLENLYNDTRVARYRDAVVVCKDLLKMYPDSFDVHFSLAETYQRLGEYDKHLEHMEKAVKCQFPHNEMDTLEMAVSTLIYYKKYDLAKKTLDREIKKHPDSSDLYLGYGNYYTALNKLKEAEKAYKKALELNPDNRPVYIRLSELYYGEKKYEKALDLLHRAEKVKWEEEGGDLEIHTNLAHIYLAMGKDKEAQQVIDRMIGFAGETYGVDMAMAHTKRGKMYMKLKEYGKAGESFLEALKINPKMTDAYLGLAEAAIVQDNIKETLSRLESAEKNVTPEMDKAHNDLGEIYYRAADYLFDKDDLKKSLECFKKALHYKPDLKKRLRQDQDDYPELEKFKEYSELIGN